MLYDSGYTSATYRSLTFVPVGPVTIRQSAAARALYESFLSRLSYGSMPFDSICVLVLPSTHPPAASVGPSVPSEPRANITILFLPEILRDAERANS